MTSEPHFVSYAQNGEDVVLWRALSGVPSGRYIDVGANDPKLASVSRAFYDRGWQGIAVEPNPEYARRYRAERPRDIVVEAAVMDAAGTPVTLHSFSGTGLSTLVDSVSAEHTGSGFEVNDIVVESKRLDDIIREAGFDSGDIHFLSVDVEGAEQSVLESIDFSRYRPWIVVVEATAPRTTRRTHSAWEPLLLEAGYEFCLFDGLSRFYVAAEHAPAISAQVDYPVCVFDEFVTFDQVRQQAEMNRLHRAVADEAARADRAESEIAGIRATLSWQLATPLRQVREKFRKKHE